MKKYHITFLRDGRYFTEFAELSSIAMFIAIEKQIGREIHMLYSREITNEEYYLAKDSGL